MDAFGSMNLGSHQEDEQQYSQKLTGIVIDDRLEQSFGAQVTEKLKQMGAQVKRSFTNDKNMDMALNCRMIFMLDLIQLNHLNILPCFLSVVFLNYCTI